jgi:hypothetical protein
MTDEKPWRIGLWEKAERIWIDFPYNEEVKEELKRKIQGLRVERTTEVLARTVGYGYRS